MAVTPKDLAETLRREYRAEREAIAAARLEARRAVAEALRELGPQRPVWLVGSLTHEGWRKESDIDLVVQGLSPGEADDLWSSLSRRLPARLEILRYEELSPAFRERVEREGEKLGVPSR
jgi:predicted nucleotidyltransferase